MDDVQHLLLHGREESFLFLLDSSKRTHAYGTPSEYEIEFRAPFKMVVGLDLIDASVPRTEYLVEAGSNVVRFALKHRATAADFASAVVEPGDYNLPQLVKALNEAFAAAQSPPAAAPITFAPHTNPSELSNKLRASCRLPFTLDMGASTMRRVLGFGCAKVPGDPAAGTSYAAAAGDKWTFCSVPADGAAAPAVKGGLPVTSTQAVGGARLVRQSFVAAASGRLRALALYGYNAGGTGADAVDVTVLVETDVAGVGTSVGTAVVTLGTAQRAQYAAAQIQDAGVLQAGQRYRATISITGPGAAAVYISQSHVPPQAGKTTRDVSASSDGGRTWQVLDGTDDLCMDASVAAEEHRLVSPGVVNLTGERYVLVRCPDVEQYLYRERLFEDVHPGLGMVKLGGYGYVDQRFDFVSFPSRRLSGPISKLGKLHIRLEKSDGTLYNAKGVDHTLLLVVKYLVVAGSAPDLSGSSVLNPGYDTDLPGYMARKWDAQRESRHAGVVGTPREASQLDA